MIRRPIHAGATLFVALMLVITGCARKSRAHVPPPAAAARIGSTQTGIASWYGVPYDGRRAANGEFYDMQQLTAAHRTLPFNTWVEVTNLDNGKRVNVRIIDRGPFVAGRVIDLSLAAAREIDMVGPGIARVKLRVIETPLTDHTPPSSEPGEQYCVQAGSFSDPAHADSLSNSLQQYFDNVRVVHTPPVWRVLVGAGVGVDAAKQLAAKVQAMAGEAMVVKVRQ